MLDKSVQIKPNTTPILFVNWTDEDFTGFWDGVPTSIPKGATLWLPFWLAVHFAKHLVDRELNKKNLRTDHPSRDSFVSKCIGNKPETKGESGDPLGIKALNANKVDELSNTLPETTEKPKARVGRPRKNPIKPVEEDSFETK